MHEIGLCESILGAVQQRAGDRRVERVVVRIGARHGVAAPALKQGFALVSTGTNADGAEIEMEIVPAELTCASCGRQESTTDLLGVCASCGSPDVTLTGGDDLILARLHFADSPADRSAAGA